MSLKIVLSLKTEKNILREKINRGKLSGGWTKSKWLEIYSQTKNLSAYMPLYNTGRKQNFNLICPLRIKSTFRRNRYGEAVL